MAVGNLLIASASTVAAFATYKLLVYLLKPQFSPLRELSGPKSNGLIWGNLMQIWKDDELGLKWEEEYGPIFVFKAFFNADRVYLSDFRALNHVLTHSNVFQKPEQSRVMLANILGDGLIVTEGDLHKKQRRVLNPCFGPSSIRDLTPIFFEKAIKLQEIWESELGSSDAAKRIDVLMWLSRAALDIVGVAGFNYELGSLDPNDDPNELALAFRQLYHNDNMVNLQQLVQTILPFTRVISTEHARKENGARETMLRIGADLLEQRKRGEFMTAKDEKTTEPPKDLLTVLVKANQDTDLPETQRMSDEEVIAQVPTFLVAGHETTSTETTWVLFSLATHPHIQSCLRAELLACPSATPSMDTLASLPYLDSVVRETLRIHPAVPGTARIANRDEEIPVGEGYVDRNGVRKESIKMKKGEGLYIPILTINRSKAIWGEDAYEFKPERWFNLPESVSSIPGVFGNLMSFLGGARGCIGYRFAVIEMKALLFTLVRNFQFELAVPLEDIEKRSVIVARPYLKSEPKRGAQLPLLVRRYRGEGK